MQYVPFWETILDSPKLMKLEPEVFRFWSLCLICAQKWDFVEGQLPDVERIAHWLRAPEDECRRLLGRLLEADLIESHEGGWKIHDWNDWRNVKDPTAAVRQRKSRDAKRDTSRACHGPVTDLSRTCHDASQTGNVTGHTDVTPNPNPNPNPNPRPATPAPAPAREGAPAREALPEVIPIDRRPNDDWEPQPLPDESMTGRSGRDHADFTRAVQILDSHHTTRRLGAELRMSCDTPGIQMLKGWQLVCGAFAVQRPDRNRSWGTLTGFARAATEAEFDKLNAQSPPRTPGAAEIPRLTDEQLRAQTEEANRKTAEYHARKRAQN